MTSATRKMQDVVRFMATRIAGARLDAKHDRRRARSFVRTQRLRVHDARIATFGARAEDVFQLTDERDQPLAETHRDALRVALHTLFEGDAR